MKEPPMTRWDLVRAGPYRIFFPLGVVAGVIGVGHWTLWSAGWLKESNPFLHATLQIQGFLTCFVIGFLMTALPRFLGTAPASLAEWSSAWAAEFCFIVLSLQKQWLQAQVCFLVAIAVTICFAARRLPHRTKSPPASFLLIGWGLAQAVAGPVLMIASHFGRRSYEWMEVGRQMLQVGFVLCLVLGIAGYLAPFLMGYAADPSCDPQATPIRRALSRSRGILAPACGYGRSRCCCI